MGTTQSSRMHRGAGGNPANRFERITLERDADWNSEDDPLPRTQFLRDKSETIITRNDGPDVGFEFTVNPYRGCEHGCIYCYARPFHEYLGFSSTGFDYLSKDRALQEHWIIRFVAILVDGLIVFAPISLLFHSVVGMSWFFSWWWIGAVLFFYSTLFDLAVGGTVGKLLMHLKSVSISGLMNSSQAVLRNITKIFPPLLLIDWIIGMAIDTNDPRQKWTDTLARTSVIRYDVRGRA